MASSSKKRARHPMMSFTPAEQKLRSDFAKRYGQDLSASEWRLVRRQPAKKRARLARKLLRAGAPLTKLIDRLERRRGRRRRRVRHSRAR